MEFQLIVNRALRGARCRLESTSPHLHNNLLPVSRFTREEVDDTVQAMRHILEDPVPMPVISTSQATMASTPSHDFLAQKAPSYSIRNDPYKAFQKDWSEGRPVVITDVQSRFQGSYGPSYFVQKYGTIKVELQDCVTDNIGTKKITVSEFFSVFGKKRNGKEILKLKANFIITLHANIKAHVCLYRTGHHNSTSVTCFRNCSVPSHWVYHLEISQDWMGF